MFWKILAAVLLVSTAIGIMVEHTVTSTQIRTIADVRSSNTLDGTVALRGTITYAKNNRFIIADGTGKAELTTCPIWYKRIGLHVGDRPTVVGQVMRNPPLLHDCDFMLSVYKVFINGEMIEVRRQPGKPPWTRYPSPGTSPL